MPENKRQPKIQYDDNRKLIKRTAPNFGYADLCIFCWYFEAYRKPPCVKHPGIIYREDCYGDYQVCDDYEEA